MSAYLVPTLSCDVQKEAIQFSWNVLTEVYKIPKDRLYFSYFEGDPKQGLHPDLEAKQYWMEVGAAEDHIVPGNAKDNFWGTSIFSKYPK
jgi:alanyl-tRNA synthetase